MKNLLSIVIVNWNAAEYLEACLFSIERETRVPHEVWIVDNASTDGSRKQLSKLCSRYPNVHFLANEKNLGFAAANNQILKRADAPYLLLLNPDTEVLECALDRMVEHLESHPEAGALGCKLLNPDFSLQPSCHAFYSTLGSLVENRFFTRLLPWRSSKSPWLSFWDHEKNRAVDWVTGACLMVRKETIEQVGLLDESFFMYGEEVDWQKRMKAKNLCVYFLAEASVIHHGGGSTRKAKIAMNRQELQSRKLFIEKHYPFFSRLLYRLKASLALRYWERR